MRWLDTVHPFPSWKTFGMCPGWAIVTRAAINIGRWILVGTLGTYVPFLLGK